MSLAAEIAKLESAAAGAAGAAEQKANGLRWRAGLTDIAAVLARLDIQIGPACDKPAGSTTMQHDLVDGLTSEQWYLRYKGAEDRLTEAQGALTVACNTYDEVVGELRAEVARLKTMPLGSTRASALAYVTGLAEKYQDECANDNALEDAEFGRQVINWLNGIRDSDPTIFEPIPGTENLHEGRDARAWATDYHEAIGFLRAVITVANRAPNEPLDLASWSIETSLATIAIGDKYDDLESYKSGLDGVMHQLDTSDDGGADDKFATCIKAIDELQRARQIAEAEISQETVLAAIDRAEEWTVQEVRDELARDPLWLAKRLGPNERLRKGLDAYAAGQKAGPVPQTVAPEPDYSFPGDDHDDPSPLAPKDTPPEAAHRFARNVIGMPEEEIAIAWQKTRPAADRETEFRDIASRYSGVVVLPESATAGAPRRTEEAETTIPDDWTPGKAQVQHGKTLGFSAEQVQNLASAFVAESLKSGALAARWGSRFRSYLTEIAATRSAR